MAVKVDFEDFYEEWPMKQPLPIEKYFMDDGIALSTRQMTYAFISKDNKKGMEPTFEVGDIILSRHDDEAYVIRSHDRSFNEIYVEAIDERGNRLNKFTYFEENDIYHKVKDVEWINKQS